VQTAFDGEAVASDAGAVFLREVDRSVVESLLVDLFREESRCAGSRTSVT
jgi:hypothetical protein